MKYYIVISISHKTIAFHYYRDDSEERRLRLFDGDWPAPLAIYCHGSQIEIGEDAAVAARRGVEGAFTDIFELARTEGVFDYNGTKYSYEKLLFHALEYYLKRFLKNTLFNRAGDLEANRADMPLFLNFGPDVTSEERDYVAGILRAGGYNNLCEIDYNRLAINRLQKQIRHNNVLILNSDGKDLYAAAYTTREYSHEMPRRECIRGKGADPRLHRAMEIIKDDIRKDNAWVEFSEIDLRRIEDEARAFIEGDRVSATVRITLSDGSSSQAYLTKATISIGADAELRTRLRLMLDDMGLKPEATTAILKGEDTCNDFFRTQLNPFFSEVLELQDDLQENVREEILNFIISANFTPRPHRPLTILPTPVSSPQPVVGSTPVDDEKARYWSREKRIRLAEAKAKARQPNYNYKAAVEMVESLLEGLKIAGIFEYNDELNHCIDEWNAKLAETSARPATRVNKDELLESVKKADDAMKKLSGSLGSINRQPAAPVRPVNVPSSPSSPHVSHTVYPTPQPVRQAPQAATMRPVHQLRTLPPNASATDYMKAERFMEAKRKFAQERNSAMAELCTKLINSNRDVMRLRSQAHMASHAGAGKALEILGTARALYVQAGIDTAGLDEIILKYTNL